MTATTVFIAIQKDGGEPTATRLIMTDRDAGILAGALARCHGLIPGEIASVLGGAFSQLQGVVAKSEPVGKIGIDEPREVPEDRVVSPTPEGVKPVPSTGQAEDPMKEVRETAAAQPLEKPAEPKTGNRKR